MLSRLPGRIQHLPGTITTMSVDAAGLSLASIMRRSIAGLAKTSAIMERDGTRLTAAGVMLDGSKLDRTIHLLANRTSRGISLLRQDNVGSIDFIRADHRPCLTTQGRKQGLGVNPGMRLIVHQKRYYTRPVRSAIAGGADRQSVVLRIRIQCLRNRASNKRVRISNLTKDSETLDGSLHILRQNVGGHATDTHMQ